jgi:hypothetical protein
MGLAESLATSPNIFKVLYPGGISKPLYEESPVLGSMKKDTEFYGIGTKYVVVSIAPGAGGSSSIATAIANQSGTQEVRFQLGRKKLYEVGSIDGETLAAGRNSKGAIVDVLTYAMDRSLEAFGRSLARAVWGNGGGSRGQLSASAAVGTPTVALTSRVDGAAFFKGMQVQLAADDGFTGSAGVIAGGTQAPLTQVQRLNATTGTTTLTLGSNWTAAIPGAAVSQFVFRAGDYAAYPSGIPAWAPTADPGSGDSFLSVNRFTAGDLNFLSGWRVFGNGQPKQQTLIDAGAECKQNGLTKIKSIFMNPLDMRDAFKEQSTFKTIDVEVDGIKIGYNAITLQTAVGSMNVFSETDIPRGFFWCLDPSTWTMRSAGDVPQLLDADGIKMFLRNPGSDDYQYRYGCYMNFENAEPVRAVVGQY